MLERSRVDLIEMGRDGIPEREYLPGAHGLLPRGKRVHVAAEKKTGKSLAIGVVLPIDVIVAGGTVAVLDRENGADESARRLRDVLDARGADDALKERAREHYRYYAWPPLRLDWADDPAYVDAFADVDLVVFDSSRSHLTPLRLKEESSDDYSAFTTALVDPLMRAGVTVIVLDNTGHAEKERARGTSAKEDLCDVAFTMKVLSAFSSARQGRVELRCIASRLGEIDGTWQMQLGGGTFGPWKRVGARPPTARTELLEATLEVLTAAGKSLGMNKVGNAIRARPHNNVRFTDHDLRMALEAWAADPASGVQPGPHGKGYTARGEGARHDPRGETPPPRPATVSDEQSETPASARAVPVAESAATARHEGHGVGAPPHRGATDGAGADADNPEAWWAAVLADGEPEPPPEPLSTDPYVEPNDGRLCAVFGPLDEDGDWR
jgi:hypothetical protein